MSTPTDQHAGFDTNATNFPPPSPPPAGGRYEFAARPSAPHPDSPPWGVLAAVGVAVGMFVLMLALQVAFVVPYVLTFRGLTPQEIAQVLQNDRTVVLLSVLSIIPAHLLTLLLSWAVVTSLGKRPFRDTLGWGWSPRFGRLEFFFLFGVTLAMLGVGQLMVLAFGDRETALTRMLANSPATRYAVAALATFTAPVVEEVVYRGLLYSALRRRLGAILSVLSVVALFAAIHFPQYMESMAALVTITLLSLVLTVVRAWTGRLMPCVIIHLLFNGITSVFIVLAPQAAERAPAPPPAPPTGALLQLLDPLTRLFL